MKKFIGAVKKWLSIFVVLGLLIWVFVFNWSFVFKRRIVGEVVAAEKVMTPLAVLTNAQGNINPQVFSFSVAVKDLKTGEIYMASSEDRQWAAVAKGNCIVAAYFPYPPWHFSKGNTSHNARLLRNFTSCTELPTDDSFWEKLKFFFLFDS